VHARRVKNTFQDTYHRQGETNPNLFSRSATSADLYDWFVAREKYYTKMQKHCANRKVPYIRTKRSMYTGTKSQFAFFFFVKSKFHTAIIGLQVILASKINCRWTLYTGLLGAITSLLSKWRKKKYSYRRLSQPSTYKTLTTRVHAPFYTSRSR
jgi:hypothetical protein